MSIRCIEILTPNLLENATATESGNTKTYTFTSLMQISKIIIKNTNLTALTVEYKANAEDNFTELTPTQENCGQDFIFTLSAPVTMLILKLTFTALNLKIGKIIAADSLLNLSDILSTLSGSVYSREGHHYLANGALIKWQDFTKYNLTLSLENINSTLKQNLENTLKNYTFLTYIFYGSFDITLADEYALSQTPFFALDRRRSLYKTTLNLFEK